jgi:tRNA G18 (ribose-2'-O)-methylase SpoU
MSIIRVTGAEDPRLADYRGVSEPELARERGLFIAEGRRVVQRLVDAGRARVRSLLLNDAALHALTSTLQKLAADTPVYVCDTASLAAVAGFNIHRGCLAIAERPPDMPFERILCHTRLLIALEDVANADNVGGVFRNAAAFGADAVLLSPSCCDPLYRKSIRTSMGASLWLPFARATQWPGALGAARDRGFAIVALTPREPAQTLDAFAAGGRPQRLLLLVGTEGAGLSAAAECLADYRVKIPIRPDVDSLNLAVATGIALARLSREASL